MAEPLIINKENKLSHAEDYNFLRKEGIRLIEELSGKVWTDYNTHDPGITLLEALCYTLTDLGYRTLFDVKDLLSTEKGRLESWENIFYTARQILPCNPVTLNDYRKVIIDTKGVRNAWIEISYDNEIPMYLESREKKTGLPEYKYALSYDPEKGDEILRLRGLYKVFVEYENDILANKKEEDVAKEIKDKLYSFRNLCEDFLSVTSIEYEDFKIDAEIQVGEGTNIAQINAQIYKVIEDFFSPPIKFYSLEQMVAKGLSAEEIFDGPALKFGFIDTKEMEASEKLRDIHLSDILSLILDIEGVIAVKKFAIPLESKSATSNFSQWVFDLRTIQKAPRLNIADSVVTFFRSGDRHRGDGIYDRSPDKKQVEDKFIFLQSADFKTRLKGRIVRDFDIVPGEFMNVSDYYPFQNVLPAIYGMAENYIDENVDDFSIRRSINELLDERVGPHVRNIIDLLHKEHVNKGPINEVINKLLDPATDEASIKVLVNDLIEDEENKVFIRRVINELFGELKKKESFTDLINEFFENKTGYTAGVSDHSKAIKALASNKSGLSLTELREDEDIVDLRNEYKKIQIDQLEKRKKQTLQLRGFLMVFEQILSDYLSQLSHTRELLSFGLQEAQTFFPEPLQGIKNLESLFIDFKKYKSLLLKMTENEADFIKRRTRILDHLLGRFGESLEKYTYFIQSSEGKEGNKKLIDDKIAFLSDYIRISKNRGRAFNYNNSENTWNTSNVAGLKKRISRLLGFKNYFSRNIASHSIIMEKVPVGADIFRYIVILTDPNDKELLLLRSIEFEFDYEAYDALNYILENGTDSTLYEMAGHRNKWEYRLTKANQEGGYDVIATSLIFEYKDDSEINFKRTIETLSTFSEDENFHLIEHILLRPQIGPREKTKKNTYVEADAVNLLTIYDHSERQTIANTDEDFPAYKFKIINKRDPGRKDKLVWKLKLLDKDDNEILLVKEDFIYYKYLTRRIEQIRQFASDDSNYKPVKAVDEYSGYSINEGDRQLAVSARKFREAKEMTEEKANIIKFFSYEEDSSIIGTENFDDVSYYVDPYSLRISIFIPSWPKKFRNPTFMHLLEKTIYLETPSHIYPSVCWLDHRQMRKFEHAYKLWLEELAGPEIPNTEVLNNLIAVLNETRK